MIQRSCSLRQTPSFMSKVYHRKNPPCYCPFELMWKMCLKNSRILVNSFCSVLYSLKKWNSSTNNFSGSYAPWYFRKDLRRIALKMILKENFRLFEYIFSSFNLDFPRRQWTMKEIASLSSNLREVVHLNISDFFSTKTKIIYFSSIARSCYGKDKILTFYWSFNQSEHGVNITVIGWMMYKYLNLLYHCVPEGN